jgi:hypothetical protein
MRMFVTRMVICTLVCIGCAGTAAAALPTVGAKEVADFLKAVREPPVYADRATAFETELVAALTVKPDLDAASVTLAPAFALTPAQARRLGELWVVYVLYDKNRFFSYDPKYSREQQDQREKVFKAELREALLTFLRATKHAPVAVIAVAKVMSDYNYDCEAANFEAIVEETDAAVEWVVAREGDCTGFWLAINARQKMHPAILLRMAEFGILSRAQRIAVVEHLRRQVPALPAESRVAVDGYLARTLAYDYWDAGLVDDGLNLYESLPEKVQRYVHSDGVPETIVFGGHPRALDQKRPEFPIPDMHAFSEQLAGALIVRGRAKEARKALSEGASFGAKARSILACHLALTGECERLESRALRWLYLDLVLNRSGDDPYDLFEQSYAGFTGWGDGGLWLELLRVTALDARYRALVDVHGVYWNPEDSSYRRSEWEGINATFDAQIQARVAELGVIFDERRRAMGSKQFMGPEVRAPRVAPVSLYFPEAKVPACKETSARARTLTPKGLPAGFAPIRAEQRGDVLAVVSLSQNYDPAGEVSGGGYWVHLSRDGGNTWESPRYTGLAQFFPYEVLRASCLALIADDRLQVEVAVKEIDTSSITYPPVGMRYRREEAGLYLDMPLAVLSRDSDGDGLTDIAEENLLLDPRNVDSDGDGLADARDPFPNVRYSGKQGRADAAMAAVLNELGGQGLGAIIEPIRAPGDGIGGWSAPALGAERPLFLLAKKDDFAGFTATRMVLIYSDEEATKIARGKADFNAMSLGPLVFNRAGTRGFISWNAGWAGGMFRVVKEGDTWRVEDLGGWIT